MEFRKWLEDCGAVDSSKTANTSAPDGFSFLQSKYIAGHRKEAPSNIEPEKKFGKKKRMKKV